MSNDQCILFVQLFHSYSTFYSILVLGNSFQLELDHGNLEIKAQNSVVYSVVSITSPAWSLFQLSQDGHEDIY